MKLLNSSTNITKRQFRIHNLQEFDTDLIKGFHFLICLSPYLHHYYPMHHENPHTKAQRVLILKSLNAF